ncbi:BCAS3 microtubule associated cell migration factor-like isoform X2 [Ornithodoros turicata]|uniref:BCAS3 microtubule associated cell migration factor-like isoform X2 n=1 Tax=Ornithodoros turicata TaxID=34597 RepID=UPI003138E98A
MAAESHRRGPKSSGLVVRPQGVINDKSYMDSVVGFINDVVPQAYTQAPKTEEKETIQWVQFASTEINDGSIEHGGSASPLLLVIGYANGVQIWCVLANGEAQEVLSWRQGPVRALNILPAPDCYAGSDSFGPKRPLVALCDSSSPGQQFCSVNIISLKTMDQVHSIKFKQPVRDIRSNKRVIIATFQGCIAVHNAGNFRERFWIQGCFPSPGPNINPVALHSRWLAYGDRALLPVHQTRGGATGDGTQSYTATVIHAAKTFTKGLTILGETVASSLTGHKAPSGASNKKCDNRTGDNHVSGVVSIVDTMLVSGGQFSTDEDVEPEGLIAHFQAHQGEPLSALQFDPSGTLLLTADRLGHDFHLFHILPHPGGPTFGMVHHLYTLHRGDTTAKVQDIAFSLDSRWIALSTMRGTTHIFPVTPYGGPITKRTHASPRVVNRLSLFHKSAGLEEIQSAPSTGRNSPVLSGSPSSSSSSTSLDKYGSGGRAGSPRISLFPVPTTVIPLSQIKQGVGFSVPSIGNPSLPRSPPVRGRRSSGSQSAAETFCVAAAFAPPRAWLVGSPSTARDKKEKNPVDSLFIMNCSGVLTEYILDPHSSANGKISEDTSIELDVTAYAQWNLLRPLSSPETKQPLISSNPLMAGQQQATAQWSFKDMNGIHQMGAECGDSWRQENDESWLSQVEIITHAGPHRRLWMGPQFTFKTIAPFMSSCQGTSQSPEKYTTLSSDMYQEEPDSQGYCGATSNPVSVPVSSHYDSSRPPLLIEATSGSFEGPPSLLEICSNWSDSSGTSSQANGQDQLMERIADAMNESPYKERQAVRTPSGGDLTYFEDVGSRCNSDVSLYHSPSQSTEHLLVFSPNQQDSI